jgi:pyridoxamine 5'-phosphate oxidase
MEDHKEYINKLRYDFSVGELDESSVDKSPIIQFERWFRDAVHQKVPDANAMVLSTASKEGRPSARVLYLRNFDENGFIFYTNYRSRKGSELEENPYAAMTFFWQPLEKQVRIEGRIEKQNEAESDVYFKLRPKGSKLGAWVSPQSIVIPGRNFLDEKLNEVNNKFPKDYVPRPPFWGGYVLKPTSIEFWQGRPSRLHDRLLYTLQGKDSWKIERLAP